MLSITNQLCVCVCVAVEIGKFCIPSTRFALPINKVCIYHVTVSVYHNNTFWELPDKNSINIHLLTRKGGLMNTVQF